MTLLHVIGANLRRAKMRVGLTILGVAVAVAAFGFLRTALDAYLAGVDAAAEDRLVVRNRASLALPLPWAMHDQIARLPGVRKVAAADWFGGVYIDERNYFAQLAVEGDAFFDLFPEFLLSADERTAFKEDRMGAIVGDKLARKYGWKAGDRVTLRGTLFPGDWTFTIRGVYRPRDASTIATQMLVHIETVRSDEETRGKALVYFVGVSDAARSAEVARAIDARFAGGEVETLSESERSFQLTFVSMAGGVMRVLELISGFVLLVVGLVLASTIASSVRERTTELAVMKALGFRSGVVAALVAAESALTGALGGALGLGLSVLLVHIFRASIDRELGTFFPIFHLSPSTMAAMVAAGLLLGLLAALPPAWRALQLPVAAALRRIG
jgi:putative ABC transport system permease protein